MRDTTLDFILDEVCGAFGRMRPDPETPVYRAIKKRVETLPDECARYVTEALQDNDRLPANLGKAIVNEFFNWLAENPDRKAKPFSCPECSSGMHGFFWAWKKDGAQYLVKCACNRDPRFVKLPAYTRKQILAEGLLLECPIKSGPIKDWQSLRRCLGTEKPRPDHLRQCEEGVPF